MTHHSSAGEGTELDSPDAKITVKIGAEHTDGSYELFEVDAPRGPTVPPHNAPWALSYYVLHGRMAVLVDGEIHDLAPGSSITIPPRSMYTFTVHTPSVRFLAISSTDAMGRFFRDLDRTVPSGRPIEDVAPQLQEVLGRHDIKVEGWSR
jgi:quercetin dioxygenase-like cupin family protein